jgi:hypothetical protein
MRVNIPEKTAVKVLFFPIDLELYFSEYPFS